MSSLTEKLRKSFTILFASNNPPHFLFLFNLITQKVILNYKQFISLYEGLFYLFHVNNVHDTFELIPSIVIIKIISHGSRSHPFLHSALTIAVPRLM